MLSTKGRRNLIIALIFLILQLNFYNKPIAETNPELNEVPLTIVEMEKEEDLMIEDSTLTLKGATVPDASLYINGKRVSHDDGNFTVTLDVDDKAYITVKSVMPNGLTNVVTYSTVRKNEPVPSGTVAIGDLAYDLNYANDPSNYDEIRSAIVNNKGKIYVKKYNGDWVDNNTLGSVKPSLIPSVLYKDIDGNIVVYNPGDGTFPEIKGIDVSKWQGEIDWKKVKAAGIEFAMIRVGYARTLDPYFHTNIKNALAAGIKVGVYLYSYATTEAEAKKEAEFVLQTIKGYKITYPVAFDIEDKSQENLGKNTLGKIINAFCSTIKEAGYTPMLYSNLNWLRNKLNYDDIKNYDLWLAQWYVRPTYTNPYTIWQYTSEGRVDGIKTYVDLNISFKDYSEKN